MNDPLLAVTKLEELIELSKCAATPFEKAAVYAATQALDAQFQENSEEFDSYALEKVESTRWSICAAVGYDTTNGHSKNDHISWALGAVSTLKDVLARSR